MKKRRMIACLAICTIVITSFFWFLAARPAVIQEVSPDGRFTARVTFPSIPKLIVTSDRQPNWDKEMRVRVYIIDNKSGKQIKVHDSESSTLFGGNEYPIAFTWNRDSRSVTYKFAQEPSNNRRKIYQVKSNPLVAVEREVELDGYGIETR